MRVVLAVFGSAGDVFPSIRIALELRSRGHDATVLAPPSVGLYTRAAGVPSVSIGDGREMEVVRDTTMYRNRFDGYSSWRRTADRYLAPVVEVGYERARERVRSLAPDVVIVHPLAPFGSLIAQELGVPWATLHLYPQLAAVARSAGTVNFGGALPKQIRAIERAGSLTRSRNPLLDLGWAPGPNLSIHDPVVVARTQLAGMRIGEPCGFPYWDAIPVTEQDAGTSERLRAAGGRLVVATLGSFIGQTDGGFWPDVARSIVESGCVGLLMGVPVGQRARLQGPSISCTGFMPLSQVLPGAEVLVHHGGIGTTYAGLRAGVPAVVVPHAFDQGFNGRLIEELGVGTVASTRGCLARTVAEAVQDTSLRRAASKLASELTPPDDAASSIVDRLERWIDGTTDRSGWLPVSGRAGS